MKRKQKKNIRLIQEDRTGGSIAIQGFNFQFLYACYLILQELSHDNEEYTIVLEGIEDIDILHKQTHVQVKTSKNPIDASVFWNMNVLKNFLDVYKIDSKRNFRFVHNTIISKGHTQGFEKKKFNSEQLGFWSKKMESLKGSSEINIEDFLNKIVFEKITKETLIKQCKQLLLKKFDLSIGTEDQYLVSLLYHIYQWSESRSSIHFLDVMKVIQFVKDSASKIPTSKVIEKNYLTEVSFTISDTSSDYGYFAGKSAKPIHIALELPVERKNWQEKIIESVNNFNVTIVKSSSGQGKSTLAWQTAYKLKDQGYSIYQLNYCNENEHIEELVDFIKTRIQIGQVPLIVIDGLDQRVRNWEFLAERLFDLPVKIIVTTREEDWYRYGLDRSKINLKFIDIHLSQEEAKSIFLKLKEKNKLYTNTVSWQSVWEKVSDRGLLIEYVYLLTQGSMIEERLSQQIKQLNKEESDASAKIEILRIVSLADAVNIKVQTKKLTKYIQENIGFASDRNEIYKLLEKEFYLQFDKKYIEGLHPVRSKHLVDILHEILSVDETLTVLLKVIDNESIYDFFLSVPFWVEDKEGFLSESAQILSGKSFINMVDAVDGLMHFEPYSYWIKNRQIYDDVSEKGFINLFVNFNPPFNSLNTFEQLNDIFKNDNFKYLLKKKNELSEFYFTQSFVSIFCLYLSSYLSKNENRDCNSYIGLGDLVKWFAKTEVILPKIINFNEDFLLSELQVKDLDDTLSLYIYCHIVYPDEYISFVTKQKDVLFSILKEKTDSLIIKDEDNELYIQYIPEQDNMNKLNHCSMKRIDILKDIFVQHESFHTEILYLPFPNELLYTHAVNESHKKISRKNLFDEFDIHLNVIWRKTIMRQYSFESMFEWQNYHIELRLKLIEFIKRCNKLIENILEGKKVIDIYPLYQDVSKFIRLQKDFPVKTIKHNEEETFKSQIAKIGNFKSPFQNFMNQLVDLFENKNPKLPFINLKDTYFKLEEMQNAFDDICKDTYQYFDTEIIRNEESYWLYRLYRTTEYFINAPRKNILFAREKIIEWYEQKNTETLDSISTILHRLEFKVYCPKQIIEKEYKEVVLGIEGFNEGDLPDLLFGLADLHKLDIDYINILRVNNKIVSYGFRIPKTFLEKLQFVLDGGEYEESDYGNPLPILDIGNELLLTLEEPLIREVSNDDMVKNTKYFKIMYDVWKLIEFRINLNVNNEFEVQWLTEMELVIKKHIEKNFSILSEEEKNWVTEILYHKKETTKEELLEKMNLRLIDSNIVL